MISKFLVPFKTPLVVAAVALAGYLLASLWFKAFNPLRWLVQTNTQLMPTLLELAEANEIEEFIAAEYFGEVLASLDEVRLRLEREVPAAYDTLRKRPLASRPAPLDSFVYSVICGILKEAKLNPDEYIKAHEFREFEQKYFKNYRENLNKKGLVYLARGKVRVTYHLRDVLAQAECEEANGERVPLKDCQIAQAKKLHLCLSDSLKDVLASINPFFVYKKDATKAIVGFEVIVEEKIAQDFDLIREVRLLANHHLEETALSHKIIERADESLRLTIEGFLRAVFASDIQVVIDDKR